MTQARPRFSILLSGPRPDTIASVFDQTFGDWELLLIGSVGESDAAVAERVRMFDTTGDHTSAVNRAIAAAVGDFLLILRPGDWLAPDALRRLARAAADDIDILYLDEVVAADDNQANAAIARKPDWSPERLRHYNYIGPALALRTALVQDAGGHRVGFGEAADYDLLLRISERAGRIVHVPTAQFRRAADRQADTEAAARLAVQEHLNRLGIAATAEVGSDPRFGRVVRRLDPGRLISIVIPTAGQVGTVEGAPRTFVIEAVRSALARTHHQRVEVIVVHDMATPADTISELHDIGGNRLVTLEYDKPFNFSEKCNLGFLQSQGDFVVLLNDDTEVVSDDWLEALVAPLEEADVGLTGAKLLYEDGSIQHGGHLYASGSRPPHPLHAYRWWPDGTGLSGDLIINRECSGVTAACAALRREVYQEIGGLSEIVPVNFNDVDLSLKVRHIGRRVLWVADCVVKHYESKSRVQSKARNFEIEFLERRWPDSFVRDRYAPWLSYKETVRPHAYKRWEE